MIVWMDILGFKDMVMKGRKSQKETQNIASILREADDLAKSYSKEYKEMDIKAGIFSDTILITCTNPDVNTAGVLIGIASIYQVALLKGRCFTRGAAVIDNHYSRANISFGPGIIRAIGAEKLAVWPRVVISPEMMSKLEPISLEKVKVDM